MNIFPGLAVAYGIRWVLLQQCSVLLHVGQDLTFCQVRACSSLWTSPAYHTP